METDRSFEVAHSTMILSRFIPQETGAVFSYKPLPGEDIEYYYDLVQRSD